MPVSLRISLKFMSNLLEEDYIKICFNLIDMTKLWAIGLMLGCALIAAVGQLFYKLGAMLLPALLTNWQLIIGFFCYGVGFLLFMTAMKGGEVSVLYPFLASSYIWTNILALMFLGESVTALKWLGSAGIVIGISLIGLGGKK